MPLGGGCDPLVGRWGRQWRLSRVLALWSLQLRQDALQLAGSNARCGWRAAGWVLSTTVAYPVQMPGSCSWHWYPSRSSTSRRSCFHALVEVTWLEAVRSPAHAMVCSSQYRVLVIRFVQLP